MFLLRMSEKLTYKLHKNASIGGSINFKILLISIAKNSAVMKKR